MNEALLIQEINGLVGFKNSTIPNYSIVSNANQTSESGLYFQGGNALVTIKNIHETQENENITNTQFNTLLTDLQNRAIIEFCRKVTSEKTRFISQNVLFPYEQDFENTYTPSGFVGIKIEPNSNQDILIAINYLTVSFDSAISLPIRLISSETGTVIATETITTIDKDAVRSRVNWKISLSNNATGGAYYIGYFVSDIGSAKPYKRDHDLASMYYSGLNIEFVETEVTGSRINVDNKVIINQPYGLNIEYSVYSDYSQKLIQNKYLLAKGIQLQMAETIIEQILNSTRSNIDERILKETRNLANYNLSDPNIGIRKRLDDEVKNVRKLFWPENRIIRATLG